ncbi:hypothetical protein [Streptomyces sp. NPDC003697]
MVCAGLGTARMARDVGLLPVRPAAHVRLIFQLRGAPPERVACLQDSSGDFGEVGVYAAPYPGNSEVREDGSFVDPEALDALKLGRALAGAAMAEELEEDLRPSAALGRPG